MSRSLREEMEGAERDSRQAEWESRQRELRENNRIHEEEWLEQQQRKEYKERANGYFDSYLLPLFRELASIKGVSMRDPYTNGLLYVLTVTGRERESYPQRSGFARTENANRHFATVSGELIWSFTPREYGRSPARWRYIKVDVNQSADVSGHCSGNLLNDGEQDLASQFLNCVRCNGFAGSDVPDDNPSP